jgi:hypothetical protein
LTEDPYTYGSESDSSEDADVVAAEAAAIEEEEQPADSGAGFSMCSFSLVSIHTDSLIVDNEAIESSDEDDSDRFIFLTPLCLCYLFVDSIL